jgi:hypothetical protein
LVYKTEIYGYTVDDVEVAVDDDVLVHDAGEFFFQMLQMNDFYSEYI